MIKDKRNIIYVVIIVIVLLLTTVGSLTFAYINRPTATGNTNISTNIIDISNSISMSYSGNTSMSLNVTLDDLSISDASNGYGSYASSTGNVTVNLTADSSIYTNGALCGYAIKYIPTTVYNSSTGAINAGLKELTISGTNGLASFYDINLGGITSETTLYTSTIFTSAGANNSSQIWTFTMKFYNLNVDQSGALGKNPAGTIKIVPTECRPFNDTLSDTVIALADGRERQSSQENGGVYRVINPEVNVPSPTTYTKLTQSEYGNVTEYQGTGSDTLPSDGTTLNERVFDYNSSDNTYSNDVTNMATSSYYHMVVPIEENASYQICYKVTTAGASNYLYASITDETSSYDGYSMVSKVLSSVGTTYTCKNLGYLTEGQGIRIVNRTYTTKAAVTFYLQKSTEMTSNGNAGVRYQGKDPNNYVQFNGTELWRIIGVFEGSTIGKESGKYYTKIIKNESIGNKYWDETNKKNNWVNASLNTYLTNTYYPSIDNASSDMIAQDVTYYLGGVPYTAYYEYTPAQFYQAERGNEGGAAAPTVVTHQNEIGLMYPSDYGYAMYDGSGNNVCNTDRVIYNYMTALLKCANYDWMFLKSYEWTISPVAGSSSNAFGVYSGGSVNYDVVGFVEGAVRPVLYLEASVGIESGEGTLGSPYILK